MLSDSAIQTIRLRPSFKMVCKLNQEQLNEKLNTYLKRYSKLVKGEVKPYEAWIWANHPEEKFWMPRLHLRLEHDTIDKVTYLRGVFGPKPSVWTFFMFSYFLFGSIFSLFLIKSMAARFLKLDDQFGYITLASLVLLIATYIGALIAKRLAKKEILILRAFVEKLLRTEDIVDEGKATL